MSLINKIFNFSYSPKITSEDRLTIAKADWETCAEWWSILNSWEWPKELLPEENPKLSNGDGTSRRSRLMAIIDKKVGHKFLLRYHNVIKDKRMTEEEFDSWWDNEVSDSEKKWYRKIADEAK